jgi:RNA polymerase sigma-70 factor (ECF subfamily)
MNQESKIAVDLFMENAPTLYGYAYSRVRDHHLAEDLVQDTMLSAWKSWDSYQGGSSVLVWLTGIMRHKLLDQWRSNARKPILQHQENEEQEANPAGLFDEQGNWVIDPNHGMTSMLQSPLEAAHNADLRKFIALCMAKLPQRMLLLFQAREVDELSVAEAAEAAGVTLGSAAVLLTRARHSLRLCLQESLMQ